jgi:hypothetical protein
MTALTSVTINDGKGTPVAHVYEPVQRVPSIKWREELPDLPVAGQGSISLNLTQAGDVYKLRGTVDLPIMEEALSANSSGYTAAPKVAHTVRGDITLFAHVRSTSDQRKDVIALFQNFLADAQIVSAFETLRKPV